MGCRASVTNLLLATAICTMLAAIAFAQAVHAPAPVESHGWVSGLDPDSGGASLLHLAPRSLPGEGVVGEAGQAWVARVLDSAPRAVPDWDRRVYLLYSRERHLLDVFSIDVVRSVSAGMWQTRPLSGASAQPSLDMGEAEFAGAFGSSRGLFVLGRAESWTLWRLAGRVWEMVELPPGLASAGHVWPVEDAQPPRLLAAAGSSLTAWEWGSEAGNAAGRWTPVELTMPEGVERSDLAGVGAVFASGHDVGWAIYTPGSDRVALYTLGPSLVGTLATVEIDGVPVAFEPLDAGQRMAILCERVERAGGEGGQPVRSWQLIEVSLVTGRELYRGPPRSSMLSIDEGLRLLSLGMMALSACVLFYLLRPVSEIAAPVVPEGWVLAPPGRRVFAALFDLWLVVGIVGATFGLPFGDFVLFTPLLESARGVLALATVVVGGAVYGTASEWMLGCTFGKALARIRVVSVDPGRPTLGLMRCGARNVFRWALAPWALLGLGSPDFRHRGDVIAGAAVVMRPGEGARKPGPGSD